MEIVLLFFGLAVGAVLTYFVLKAQTGKRKFSDEEATGFQNDLQQLKVDYAGVQERSNQVENQLRSTTERLEQTETAMLDLSNKHIELQTKHETAIQDIEKEKSLKNQLYII